MVGVSLFGVFDGHGGTSASSFCSSRIGPLIDSLQDVFEEKALTEAMIKLDQEFLQTSQCQHGCTSVWFVIRPLSDTQGHYQVAIANLGDSRCVWMDKCGNIKFVTQDHKPYLKVVVSLINFRKNQIENNRIVEAGGFVSGDRVDGQLAVARAIGDIFYKSNSHLPPQAQKVSCVPDISMLTVPVGDFFLVACDGLFEKLSTEQLAEHISPVADSDPAKLAVKLMDFSLASGSRDNMSAIVIALTNGSDYNKYFISYFIS